MRTKTRYVLCGLLAEGPQTGYQLKKLIDERFKAFWNESYGQIYPELKSLCDEGYIEIEDKKKNARKNTRYKLTAKGFSLLETWLEKEPEKESVRLEILLKTYFSKHGSKVSIIDYLEQFKLDHYSDLNELTAFKNQLGSAQSLDQLELLSVVDFSIKVNKAYIQWCDESLKQFKKELVV